LGRLLLRNRYSASAATFHPGAGVSSAHDADDRIVHDSSSSALYYGADGIGGVAAIRFAVLAGHPALGAGDFLIVG
jgi:Ca2+-binding RTX toxin-like protein